MSKDDVLNIGSEDCVKDFHRATISKPSNNGFEFIHVFDSDGDIIIDTSDWSIKIERSRLEDEDFKDSVLKRVNSNATIFMEYFIYFTSINNGGGDYKDVSSSIRKFFESIKRSDWVRHLSDCSFLNSIDFSKYRLVGIALDEDSIKSIEYISEMTKS